MQAKFEIEINLQSYYNVQRIVVIEAENHMIPGIAVYVGATKCTDYYFFGDENRIKIFNCDRSIVSNFVTLKATSAFTVCEILVYPGSIDIEY